VYGEVKDFKSISFAAKLFEFSQEMQINSVKQALTEFFKKAEASELFELFDIFVTTGNEEGIKISKLVRKAYMSLGHIFTKFSVSIFKASVEPEIKRSLRFPGLAEHQFRRHPRVSWF